jgi:hypothetical protein
MIEAEWVTTAGLHAAVLFVHDSHRCGYVEVPPTSQWYGVNYNCVDVEVHGGLTYSEMSEGTYPTNNPWKWWWFGFDCAHLGDATKYNNEPWDIMRSLEYVKQECEYLARQLIA